MSATLNWAFSGLGTKTGTTSLLMIDDLDTLVTSFSANAAFSWQTAGKNSTATSPQWIVLSRKSGAAGRILIVNWSAAPAGNNAAILDTAPTGNQIYIAWFPNGTANTASNLTAASGTIMGNDTNAVKVSCGPPLGTAYGANVQWFFFDSAEGAVFGFGNPTGTSANYMIGAGLLVIDSADVAYDCTFGTAATSVGPNWGSSGTVPIQWQPSSIPAGQASATVRANYGAANKQYFMAWAPSGVWASTAVGVLDILTDTSISASWYVPTQLLGQVKGEGFAIKFRQFGYGHGTTGAFAVENTTGPVVASRCFCPYSTGGNGNPWFTNFKI